jgi:hypothetical protein
MSTRLPALIKVGRHSELRLALALLEKLFAFIGRRPDHMHVQILTNSLSVCRPGTLLAHIITQRRKLATPRSGHPFCKASRMPPGPLNLGHLCSARPSLSIFVSAVTITEAQDAPHIKPNCVLCGAQADAHAPASGLMLRRQETDTPNLIESCLVSTAAAGHDVQKQESGEEGENDRAAPKWHPQRVRKHQWAQQ